MNNLPRNLSLISIIGFLAVALGAFGSHSLKTLLDPDLYHAWQTAVEYQFYHILALFLCSYLPLKKKWFQRPEFWFIMGIFCFSGSLYFLSLLSLKQIHIGWVGIFTPIGGLFFLLGWICLGFNSKWANA